MQRLLVFALVMVACGKGGCTPPTTTNLRISNHGVTFATTVATGRTYAWNQADLGDIAVIPGAENASTLFLRGSYPRELYVFDAPSSEETAPGLTPWHAPEPYSYMTLPGSVYGKTGDASRDVPMGVMMARLVDHGECSRMAPFTDLGSSTPGLFHQLNDALYTEVAAMVSAKGFTTDQNFASYQPAFLKSASDFADTNEDGFALRVQYHIMSGRVHVETLYLAVTYRVYSSDGFFRVAPVGSIEVLGPSGGTAAAKLRDLLPTKLFTQSRALYGRKLMAKDGSTGAWCTPDADCSSLGKLALAQAITPSVGAAKATGLTSTLHNSSFFCQPTGDSHKGVCTYIPYFKRFNVLPGGLEGVWYDEGEPPSADWNVYAASLGTGPVVVGECASSRTVAIATAPERLIGWGFGDLD